MFFTPPTQDCRAGVARVFLSDGVRSPRRPRSVGKPGPDLRIERLSRGLTVPLEDVSHPVPSRETSRVGWGPGRPRILKTGGRREEDFPTQPQEPQANPWLPQADEHAVGPQCAAPPAPQGPQAAHRQRLEEVAR